MQEGWFWNWLIFHDPFTFLAFWVFFTCATASVKRAPFDLAEAESELVAGFHTEYSGLRWSFFFMAEYSSMFAVSGIAAILFLGGWNGPIPVTNLLGFDATYAGRFIGMLNFMGKAFFLVFVMMWVRWTLPRLRIDQVMKTCLKYLLPMSCAALLGAAVWPLVLPGGVTHAVTGGSTTIGRPLGAIYERLGRRPATPETGREAANRAAAQPAATEEAGPDAREPAGTASVDAAAQDRPEITP
jgi:NADH-quinone oxidoreductase subunit H